MQLKELKNFQVTISTPYFGQAHPKQNIFLTRVLVFPLSDFQCQDRTRTLRHALAKQFP